MSEKQKTVETVVKQPAAQSTIKRFFELLFMLFSAILVLFSWDSARKVIRNFIVQFFFLSTPKCANTIFTRMTKFLKAKVKKSDD